MEGTKERKGEEARDTERSPEGRENIGETKEKEVEGNKQGRK